METVITTIPVNVIKQINVPAWQQTKPWLNTGVHVEGAESTQHKDGKSQERHRNARLVCETQHDRGQSQLANTCVSV